MWPIPSVEKLSKLLVLGLYPLPYTGSGNSQLNQITSHAHANVFDYKASMRSEKPQISGIHLLEAFQMASHFPQLIRI